MSDVVKELRASVAMDAMSGDALERQVCANQMARAAAEIERLRAELSQRPPSYDEYYDTMNWRGAVTHKLQPDVPGDISRGRALELISELMKQRCRMFRVQRDDQRGTCYSFYDHFDVWWDNGDVQCDVIDLSYIGVQKAVRAAGGWRANMGGRRESEVVRWSFSYVLGFWLR